MNVQTLRVATLRSQNPKGFGGCIFTGTPIDAQGNVQDARAYFVVNASKAVLGHTCVQVGQWWRITGDTKKNSLVVNGYQLTEWQIAASEASLLLPSGEHIVSMMAESAEFRGVGFVKARKLWESFGEALYSILDHGDIVSLGTVLTEESARQVAEAWSLYGDTRTLQWLHSKGFDSATGRKVVVFFGRDAADKIEADPYRLLSFCATWKQVDTLARQQFGISETDSRRLQGAIEEACYCLFGEGHTVATPDVLMSKLLPILGKPTADISWRSLVQKSLASGQTNGSYVVGAEGNLHPLGPFVMENVVARAVFDRLRLEDTQLLTCEEVEKLVVAYEGTEGIALNAEQNRAIQMASKYTFSLVTGGAGVGKTTVLKAIYSIYDAAGVHIVQMALAGRAAKRMQEATGRGAFTIAGFLRNTKQEDLARPCVVVIDEASMVDIITMSRLCELLPSHVRLLMVGDPNQLMPVGPGLVLHELAAVRAIPLAELKVVKRHGDDIASAALAIRDGVWPNFSDIESAPICFLPCATQAPRFGSAEAETLENTILRLYLQDPENSQILSSRRNGVDGTRGLNTLLQKHATRQAAPLLVWNSEHDSLEHTGFHLGDLLLCTRNMWDWGLQNGSLGKLVQIEETPRLLKNDEGIELGYALAWAMWDDGERRPILETMLDDLELGYAITVHKAQGSQWPRIIVPISGNRLLDRTLVYTAVTRAQRQVILVGGEDAARTAVQGLPRAKQRKVALGSVLTGLIASIKEAQ